MLYNIYIYIYIYIYIGTFPASASLGSLAIRGQRGRPRSRTVQAPSQAAARSSPSTPAQQFSSGRPAPALKVSTDPNQAPCSSIPLSAPAEGGPSSPRASPPPPEPKTTAKVSTDPNQAPCSSIPLSAPAKGGHLHHRRLVEPDVCSSWRQERDRNNRPAPSQTMPATGPTVQQPSAETHHPEPMTIGSPSHLHISASSLIPSPRTLQHSKVGDSLPGFGNAGAQHRVLRMILSALGLNPYGLKTRHTGESNRKQAVICSVLGANPPFSVMEEFLKRIWKAFEIDRILMVKRGMFLVRFLNLQDKQAVEKRGLYFLS
ncbi:hypothetical protein Cgig2_003360 [Carnegiea gigantea]|uniref:DUF4283 domain-containing protein n=1 Tax=Carnegiea gigantea TaxID=171969 RepID=A0A9Q1JF98_9CARY|nr:hypothetical protein Cgig2_003360 [Carnegiea gigantea]